MLLKLVKINDFGLFNNFIWDNNVRDKGGNKIIFQKMNIIYARNYSGKTTLSRILQCLESKQKNQYYPNAECEYLFENNITVSTNDLQTINKSIKVYNKDFVNLHLNWSHDSKGNIKPFSVIGEENIEITAELAIIEPFLAIDPNNNNCFEYHIAASQSRLKDKSNQSLRIDREIKSDSAQHAKYMKDNRAIYGVKSVYNQSDLDTEISIIKNIFYVPFSQDIEQNLKMQAQEALRAHISYNLQQLISTIKVKEEAQKALDKTIKPSTIISTLNKDNDIYEWVYKGLTIHKSKKLNICSFCSSTLPVDLLDNLDKIFSDEIKNHTNELDRLCSLLNDEIAKISNYHQSLPTSNELFRDLVKDYDESQSKLKDELFSRASWLFEIKTSLENKKKNIYQSSNKKINGISNDLQSLDQIQHIIKTHNNRCDSFELSVSEAKKKLAIQSIFNFMLSTDYYGRTKIKIDLAQEIKEANSYYTEIKVNHDQLLKHFTDLQKQKVSQLSGILKINEYLTHYFSANHLELLDLDDGTSFKIMRDGKEAHHLSEGECSLISFCYFMAKLKEINNLEHTIIWIDDPISSLDNNHIFYMFSLIENEIAKPIVVPNVGKKYRYKQIFISTHNLDFLKYLRRLSYPIIKQEYDVENCIHSPKCKKKRDMAAILHFIIERQINHSSIKLMPEYLKTHSTEYNYLFSKIYSLAHTNESDLNEDFNYNFGNNLRKFLEAHLYFKYPTNKLTPEDKMRKFITDGIDTTITQRLTNELSHLEECFDRSMSVLDIAENKKLAVTVLQLLNANDPQQYQALVNSL